MRKLTYTLLCVIILTSCIKESEYAMSKDERYIVKVFYYSSNSFMELYGEQFMGEHPNVLIDVIPFPIYLDPVRQEEEITRIVKEDKPDLIFVSGNRQTYRNHIKQGVLFELSPLIRDDKILSKEYHPGVLQATKDIAGEDAVYGLSATFERKGLYYNTELFSQTQAAPPVNGMSWNDVINKAEEFRGSTTLEGQPVIGLTLMGYSSIFSLIADYAAAEQLMLTHPDIGVLFGNGEWRRIAERVLKGIQDGYIHMPHAIQEHQAPKGTFQFNEGNIAMMIASNHSLDNIQQIEWDMVQEPVFAPQPDLAVTINIPLFAIHKDTGVLPAAWELLKFIIKERSVAHEDRNDYLYTFKPDDKIVSTYHQESFYDFTGIYHPPQEVMPVGFIDAFKALAEAYLLEAVSGNLTIDEAIDQIQEEGQEMWVEYYSNAGG